jgi:Zn-dependent protease with chaperone function
VTHEALGTGVLNGGVIDPGLPGGRAGAELRVHETRLHARVDGRSGLEVPVERTFPLEGAHLEVGGASGRMLFLRHPSLEGRIAYTEDPAVIGALRDACDWGQQQGVFAGLERARRGARAAIPAWIAGLALAAWLLLLALERAVGWIPMEVDRKIGAFAEPQLLSQAGGPALHDAVVTDAVRSILHRVVDASPTPELEVELTVVDAPAVNAFALPGGYVVVYTGLLRDAKGPEEVAGVLAHELAHVTERHGLRRLARSAGIVLVVDTLLGDVAGMLGAAREFFTLAAVNDYSREQEEEADAVGVRTLHAAGIDPRASRAFFERLAQESEGVPGERVLAWIATHPRHAERVVAIDAAIADLGRTTVRPLEVDWAPVLQRLGQE